MDRNLSLSDQAEGRSVLSVRAELDHVSARDLRATVDEELAQGRDLQIDLSNMEFVDSTGMYALLLCSQRAAELGRDLQISGPLRPQPLRTLRLTGMDTKLAIDPVR